jgi:cell division protein FtsZ
MPNQQITTQTDAATPAPLSIQVIGVGSAGIEAVQALSALGLPDLRYAALHTDTRKLSQSLIERKVLLGASLTRGLGAGGDADIGRAAAEGEAAQLSELCQEADLVILLAGMGKGTGSGAAPVVARLAREAGALVLAFATLPFAFESAQRRRQALAALRQLRLAADAVICLPNQQVAGFLDANTSMADTLRAANQMLAEGVCGIWRLITRDGLINVTFADLCHVVRGRQAESCLAAAEASGENRAKEALEKLLASPMFDGGKALQEADALLVSLVGGEDLKQREVELIMEALNRLTENAEVMIGAAVEPDFAGRLAITLVAAKRQSSQVSAAPNEEALDPPPPASEFPITEEAAAEPGETAADRPPSRFVPPPPALTPQIREQLIQRHAGGPSRNRRRAARLRQEMLPLEVVSKGRFAKSEPTIHRGEDLDTPTYIRKGVPLN